VISPVLAAGVLVAHALAYRITGTPTERFHAYLGHAPQILLLLTLSGIVLGGLGRRGAAPAAHVFPLVAVTTFALQEHLERILHGGAFPVLVTSPAFVVGLLLQVPAALIAWFVSRWLIAASGEAVSLRRALRANFDLRLVVAPAAALGSTEPPGARGRGPPLVLRPR
jgi:predicted Co/Zn/Cd cation transporter (cation efflux family)